MQLHHDSSYDDPNNYHLKKFEKYGNCWETKNKNLTHIVYSIYATISELDKVLVELDKKQASEIWTPVQTKGHILHLNPPKRHKFSRKYTIIFIELFSFFSSITVFNNLLLSNFLKEYLSSQSIYRTT